MKEAVVILIGVLCAGWVAYSIILTFKLVILVLSEFLNSLIQMEK